MQQQSPREEKQIEGVRLGERGKNGGKGQPLKAVVG